MAEFTIEQQEQAQHAAAGTQQVQRAAEVKEGANMSTRQKGVVKWFNATKVSRLWAHNLDVPLGNRKISEGSSTGVHLAWALADLAHKVSSSMDPNLSLPLCNPFRALASSLPLGQSMLTPARGMCHTRTSMTCLCTRCALMGG